MRYKTGNLRKFIFSSRNSSIVNCAIVYDF